MKALHVTFGFPPDPPGGTELYVMALCRALDAHGVKSVVAAPGPRQQAYNFEGISVRRFAINQHDIDLAELYGEGDPRAAAAFDLVLDEVRPDVVHQHALTAACSLQLARRVKARGIPLVFTYHTPTTTCERGTLLEWGRQVCDGRLETQRCTACTLQGLGASRTASRLFSCTPEILGAALSWAGLHGGVWTALRMRRLSRQHHDAVREFLGLVDRFVALTPWVRALLVGNGVPHDKIVDSAHGLLQPAEPHAARPTRANDEAIRIAHFGRLDPTKGTELLIRALQANPTSRVSLDIFGIVQSDTDAAMRRRVLALIGSDPRVRLLAAIPQAEVSARLAEYDLLAVPSQLLETGPLVVLEAFAAGVPVVGSALGGIAHQIRDEVDGILVRPHDSVEAWGAALDRFVQDRSFAARLSQAIRPVRRAADVAADMRQIYGEVCRLRTAANKLESDARSGVPMPAVEWGTTR